MAGWNATDRRGKVRFLLSSMLSRPWSEALFLVVVLLLSAMYFNTIAHSSVRFPILQVPHFLLISALLGIAIGLGISSNVYVMKVVMGGGEATTKAAAKTTLSMAAGAVGCIGSIASVLISLGIGISSGALAFLSTNLIPFFALAGILSLVSIKLAADTFVNVAPVVSTVRGR